MTFDHFDFPKEFNFSYFSYIFVGCTKYPQTYAKLCTLFYCIIWTIGVSIKLSKQILLYKLEKNLEIQSIIKKNFSSSQ